ncbi:MAG TPA: hypothetical protein VJ984_03680 [Xanthomonadales bacterium]|nr:hypothetical protein [Xanthomonadales bacterium]
MFTWLSAVFFVFARDGNNIVSRIRPGVGLLVLFFFALVISPNLFAQAVLEGRLDTIWGDPHPDSDAPAVRVLTLTEDNGRITELYVSEDLLRAAGGFYAWNGKRVLVNLRAQGQELPGLNLRAGTRQAVSLTLLEGNGESPDAPDITGSHPWVSILCKFSDINAEPEDLAYFTGMYANAPGGLDGYWREVSYDNIDIVGSTAVDWVDLPGTQTSYIPNPGNGTSANLNALFDDCTDAADPFIDFSNGGTGGYSGINMMFNANLDCCAWGGSRFATLDGVTKSWRTTWEPPWGYANSGVMSHEMGHGFGLPHANNWDNDGNPYDSPWDVMSSATSNFSVTHPTYGRLGQHINMHHKMQLDWIAPARLLQVSDGESVTATIDASALAGSSNYYVARLPIPGSNRFYTVEVRKQIGGYDGNLPGNAVIIHEVVPGRSEPAWAYDVAVPPANYGSNEGTMFRVGETFSNEPEEIFVTILSETTNGFVVEIDRNGPEPGLDFIDSFE